MQKYRQKAATTRNDDRHKQKVDADWEAKEETKLHQVRQNAAKRLAFVVVFVVLYHALCGQTGAVVIVVICRRCYCFCCCCCAPLQASWVR